MSKFKEQGEHRGLAALKEECERETSKRVRTPLQIKYPDHDHRECLKDSIQGNSAYYAYHIEPNESEEEKEFDRLLEAWQRQGSGEDDKEEFP